MQLRRRADPDAALGWRKRLASHASGRRSGDQFCVYVADRLELPDLTNNEIQQLGSGETNLDLLVREFILRNLGYRRVEVPDGRSAFQVEKRILSGALAAGQPLLNAS
jgi:hypothetical protein